MLFGGHRVLLDERASSDRLAPHRNGDAEIASGQNDTTDLGPNIELPAPVRTRFEAGLGENLGDVRLHVGPEAAAAAQAQRARAFTVGHHIAFDENQYQPGTAEGDHLLAHELAHVVQQTGSVVVRPGPAPSADLSELAARVREIMEDLDEGLEDAVLDPELRQALQVGLAHLQELAAGSDDRLKADAMAYLQARLPVELAGTAAGTPQRGGDQGAADLIGDTALTAQPTTVARMPVSGSLSGDTAEQDAERVAAVVTSGGHAGVGTTVTRGAVQRFGGDLPLPSNPLFWLATFIVAVLATYALWATCAGGDRGRVVQAPSGSRRRSKNSGRRVGATPSASAARAGAQLDGASSAGKPVGSNRVVGNAPPLPPARASSISTASAQAAVAPAAVGGSTTQIYRPVIPSPILPMPPPMPRAQARAINAAPPPGDLHSGAPRARPADVGPSTRREKRRDEGEKGEDPALKREPAASRAWSDQGTSRPPRSRFIDIMGHPQRILEELKALLPQVKLDLDAVYQHGERFSTPLFPASDPLRAWWHSQDKTVKAVEGSEKDEEEQVEEVDPSALQQLARTVNAIEQEFCTRELADRPVSIAGLNDVMFGTEFTFTHNALRRLRLGDALDKAAEQFFKEWRKAAESWHPRPQVSGPTPRAAANKPGLSSARPKSRRAREQGKSEGSQGDVQTASTPGGKSKHRTVFTYTLRDGETWWWALDVDHGCLETQTQKSTAKQLGGREIGHIIAEHIFKHAGEHGLEVDTSPAGGGGHISVDVTTAFGGSAELFLATVLELQNNVRVWQEQFHDDDVTNAPWLEELKLDGIEALAPFQGQVQCLLEEVTAGNCDLDRAVRELRVFNKRLSRPDLKKGDKRDKKSNSDIDNIKGQSDHYQAVNIEHVVDAKRPEERRLELRRIPAQTDHKKLMADLNYIVELLERVRQEVLLRKPMAD